MSLDEQRESHSAEPDRSVVNPENDLAFDVPLGFVPVLALAGCTLAFVAFGWSPLLVVWLPLVCVLALVTVIDLRELRVPNRIVGPAALVAPALLLVSSLGGEPTVSFSRSLLGGLAMFGVYFALAVISPAGMGMGDVKLSPLIGSALALLSWQHWTRGLVWAFVSMAVVSIVLIASRIANRKSALPFAPFMALGALIAIVV